MARFSPGTGELILQAAQGVVGMLENQRRFAQRERLLIEQQKEKEEIAAREQEKHRLELEIMENRNKLLEQEFGFKTSGAPDILKKRKLDVEIAKKRLEEFSKPDALQGEDKLAPTTLFKLRDTARDNIITRRLKSLLEESPEEFGIQAPRAAELLGTYGKAFTTSSRQKDLAADLDRIQRDLENRAAEAVPELEQTLAGLDITIDDPNERRRARARLTAQIDNLTSSQKTIVELQKRMHDIRREITDDEIAEEAHSILGFSEDITRAALKANQKNTVGSLSNQFETTLDIDDATLDVMRNDLRAGKLESAENALRPILFKDGKRSRKRDEMAAGWLITNFGQERAEQIWADLSKRLFSR